MGGSVSLHVPSPCVCVQRTMVGCYAVVEYVYQVEG